MVSLSNGTDLIMNASSDQQLRERGVLVGHLNRALSGGLQDLRSVPDVLRRVIRDDMWQARIDPTSGRRYTFETFAEFVDAPPPGGLATDEGQLRGLCAHDIDVRDLLDQALQREGGRPPETVYNIHSLGRPGGTSEARALRRLRNQRPDLHGRVLAGELSAHAAALEAGFRRRTVTIRVDSAEQAVAGLLRADRGKEPKFTKQDLRDALGED